MIPMTGQNDIPAGGASQKDASKKDVSRKGVSKRDTSQKDVSRKDISKRNASQKDVSRKDSSSAGTAPEQGAGTAGKARRDYKDTLFRMIFNDKAHLLALYNAVNQTSYTDPEQLKIVTLENAIYMNMKNDLAFLLGFELNLYEHQSTWNPNMPLRSLFYAAREYETLVQENSLYSSRPLKIPTPRFIVFYNGTENKSEKTILRLSDSFETPVPQPELELTVTVFNINSGFNQELLGTCRLLGEYSLYVARVRKYARVMGLNEAVETAVTECINEGILDKFLIHYRAEAISMSIFEYNEERERELLRKAEFEYGREQGVRQGVEQGILAVIQTCRELGASRDATVLRLKNQFSLSDKQAGEYMGLYWK